MLIGEGPGRQEVLEHRPFVGPAGKLLRELCSRAGVDFDACYVTNATLCKPPRTGEASFLEAYPNAVTSCLPRLEAEIASVRPKVIVTLGAAAWLAISGYDVDRSRRVETDCARCQNTRRVGPVLQCAAPVPSADGTTAKPCHHLHFLRPGASMEAQGIEVELIKSRGCEGCGAKMKRLRAKMIKCPACGGRKTQEQPYTAFVADYSITAAAGAIFTPAAPGAVERKAHELHPWLGELGVQYVVPVLHPSYILRGQSFAATAVSSHLGKAARLLKGAKPLQYDYEVTKDPARVRAWFRGRTEVAVDIETIGKPTAPREDGTPGERLDARKIYNVAVISCIGFAAAPVKPRNGVESEALVVDTTGVDPNNPADPLLEALFAVMGDDAISKTFHHGGGYDLLVLDLIWGFPVAVTAPSYKDDTLCAHSNLYPDAPHKLGAVATELLDVYAWKPARTVKGAEVHGSFAELAAYNARDVIHTDLARRALGVSKGGALPGGRMVRHGLAKVYTLDSVLRQEAACMTMAGLPLDRDGWANAGAVAQGHIDAAVRRIEVVVEHLDFGVFNPRSTRDKIQLLYHNARGFGLPVIKTTAPTSKTPATDAATLLKLTNTTKNPLALEFLGALRELLKHDFVAKNFVFSEAMTPWADGRIHTIWQPWGAKTGRWTSSPNCQNWPKWLRALIVAPAGRKIVGADYDQLELRNMALLTGDPELIRRCSTADDQRKLEPEHDPHSFVAAMAFGARFESLSLADPAHKKDPKCKCQTCARRALRDLTKRVVYGLNYGAGEAKVLESIYDGGYEGPPITIEMIALVKRTVFTAFAQVSPWRDDQVLEANRTGELRSPLLGRRRIFPLATAPVQVRETVPTPEIYNYPIQSMGADIINTQMASMLMRLHAVDPSAFCIAQVHDAIYVETSEDRADAVAKLLTETLTVEHELDGAHMLFTASGSVADSWKDAG